MKFVYSDGGRSNYFKKENVGDCAVRAIANATGKDYLEVYNALNALNGGVSCRNGTPHKVTKKYMKSIGWEYFGVNRCAGEMCRLDENYFPLGTVLVCVSKHVTCVKDGVLYDTYDCSRDGERTVYYFFAKPNTGVKKINIKRYYL